MVIVVVIVVVVLVVVTVVVVMVRGNEKRGKRRKRREERTAEKRRRREGEGGGRWATGAATSLRSRKTLDIIIHLSNLRPERHSSRQAHAGNPRLCFSPSI